MSIKTAVLLVALLAVASGGALLAVCTRTTCWPLAVPLATPPVLPTVAVSSSAPQSSTLAPAARLSLPAVDFVGPRENIPPDVPSAYGFWSFAIPVPSVLSRSGQPLVSEFEWLRAHGWRGVVSLRVDGERGEIGDDMQLPGFTELGFAYLHLPITDGHPPTDEQAAAFLAFITDPANQPIHVHCRGGFGRTGTMTALYRYAVQGWPMETAIAESRAFRGGISQPQKTWLMRWAATHPPGSHAVH